MPGTSLEKCTLFPDHGGAPRGGGPAGRKRESTWLVAIACLAVLAAAVACGGGSKKHKSYERGISEQESCCNELSDPQERQACMDDIVRVDDPEVASSEENQATYSCIEQNFVCNPSTGRATQESAQAQLDCIDKL